MFRSLCRLALFVFVGSAPVAAQDAFSLSPRLGAVIDAAERAYFGLFPGVDDFGSAEAVADGDSVRFSIARAERSDTVVVMLESTASLLGRFVESFEHYEAAYYNPAWQRIRDYVRTDVPVPYAGGGRRMFVISGGNRYRGRPIYASDSLLVLDPSHGAFDWQTFDGRGMVFERGQVQRVQFAPDWLNRSYVALAGIPLGLGVEGLMGMPEPRPDGGALIQRKVVSAALGAVAVRLATRYFARAEDYEDVLSDVKRAAWFTGENSPLEMPGEAELRQREGGRNHQDTWDPQFGWLSIELASSAEWESEASYGYSTNFDPEDTQHEVLYLSPEYASASAALKPIRGVSVGGELYFSEEVEFDPRDSRFPNVRFDRVDRDDREVAYARPRYGFFGEVDVVRIFFPSSWIGAAAVGGVQQVESVVTRRFAARVTPTGIYGFTPAIYEISERGFTSFYGGHLELSLPFDLSLFASRTFRTAPSIDVPRTEVYSSFVTDALVFVVDPHTVTFESTRTVFGFRVGF